MSKTAISTFEEIYRNNTWGHGSGEGSLPQYNVEYISFLESFIRIKDIATIVDMGCGDWQFSSQINWGKANYIGFDVVKSVIDNNQSRYTSPNVSFQTYSGKAEDLPTAELLIVKDVLQHLPNNMILDFLKCVNRYKYALITNCVNPRTNTTNRDIRIGKFRYLDLRLPPFDLRATEVFSFCRNRSRTMQILLGRKPQWRKSVLLLNNPTWKGADEP